MVRVKVTNSFINKIKVRQERTADHKLVFKLIEKAFSEIAQSDHTEHHLVNRLRKSAAFIPELSLVAEYDNQIIGHILLTKVHVENKLETFTSLALAPVSVQPKYQRQGIGSKLISSAHSTAKRLGFESVVLIGHQDYYPKFGYQQSHLFGIEFPFDAPKENCMAVELVENALKAVSGTVVYPKEFYE